MMIIIIKTKIMQEVEEEATVSAEEDEGEEMEQESKLD